MRKLLDLAVRFDRGMDDAADRVWDVLEWAWRPLRTPFRIFFRCLEFIEYAIGVAFILYVLLLVAGAFLRNDLCGELVVFGDPIYLACGGVCGQWDIFIFTVSIACGG